MGAARRQALACPGGFASGLPLLEGGPINRIGVARHQWRPTVCVSSDALADEDGPRAMTSCNDLPQWA